jgi:probable F420-dependent oxidoreductase
MLCETTQYLSSVAEAGPHAARAEAQGYDTWWATETKTDIFVASAVAAAQTHSIRIATGVAVALARTPMTTAVAANDLQELTNGRFVLGLGSQVSAHITKRFSMPWSRPAARMREFIIATRTILDAWQTQSKLDFRGDFYTHTLMTPMFAPPPNAHGAPPIHLAAVGPKMTEVAGEVADGVVVHGFCTERYLREVTIPALQRGAERAGRTLDGFEINAPGMIQVAGTEEQRAAAATAVRGQIGFYGSTPAYRAVLELHGWGALGEDLERLSKSGGWNRMAGLVDDEVLDAFAVIGTPDHVAAELHRRYGDVCTRVVVGDHAGEPLYAGLPAAFAAAAA